MISVIIPNYNQAEFLDEALQSIEKQNYNSKYEIIVVDDASTLNGEQKRLREICTGRAELFFNKQNVGLGATRNIAVRKARGDIILPLDADDRFGNNYLEVTHRSFEEDKDCDFIYFNIQHFGDNDIKYIPPEYDPAKLMVKQYIVGTSPIRRNMWECMGGWSEDPVIRITNVDWDFWIGAAEQGLKGKYVADIEYQMRIRKGSMSDKGRRYRYMANRRIVERHPVFFERFGGRAEFLIRGFIVSYEAEIEQKNYLVAARYVISALKLKPCSISLWKRAFSIIMAVVKNRRSTLIPLILRRRKI